MKDEKHTSSGGRDAKSEYSRLDGRDGRLEILKVRGDE